MKRIIVSLTIFAGLFLPAILHSQTVERDLLNLNRAIVTARYYYHESPNATNFAVSVSNLYRQWKGFQDSYYNIVTNYAGWKKDVEKLDYLFYQALNGLRPASMRTNSARSIDEAETITGSIRNGLGNPHILDKLPSFRSALGELNSMCAGNTITQTAYGRVNSLIDNLAKSWEQIFVFSVDVDSSYMSVEELESYKRTMEMMPPALEKLKKAIQSRSLPLIKETLAAVNKIFYSFYYTFGRY